MIDRALIERVLQLTRIDEVIGPYVSLKRRGANLLGLCPFHKEKTPSFTVSVTKGLYKCFGCGKAGNALGFLMDIEQISFIEALRRLAAQCGVDLQEQPESAEELEARNRRERLMEVMAWANDYFRRQLLETGEGRREGLAYFTNRGLTPQIVESFQLGYSPNAASAITEAGLQRGFTLEELVAVGLTGTRENSAFDRFRGRVIFPIHSLSSRVLAFAGRALQVTERTAKYINSPGTELYQKGDMLFGLWRAKQEIVRQGRAIVVEGYMDVLSMHQLGITHVVATCGTSLTGPQAALLRRFCSQITLLYDGDSAGIKAAERALDILLEEGLSVEVVLLPEGKDPDDFARSHTLEEVQDYLSRQAKDLIGFKGRSLFSEADAEPSGSAADRASITHGILETIALIEDPVTRAAYVYELSKQMHMAQDVLSEQVGILHSKRQRAARKAQATQGETSPASSAEGSLLPPQGLKPSTRGNYTGATPRGANTPVGKHELPIASFEHELLFWLLLHGVDPLYLPEEIQEYRQAHAEETPLLPSMEGTVADFILAELESDNLSFETPLLRAVYDEYVTAYRQGEVPTVERFTQSIIPEIAQLVINMTVKSYPLSRRWSLRSRDIGFKDLGASGHAEEGAGAHRTSEATLTEALDAPEEPQSPHAQRMAARDRRQHVEEAIMAYKGRIVERMTLKLHEALQAKDLPQAEIERIFQELARFNSMRTAFADALRRDRL